MGRWSKKRPKQNKRHRRCEAKTKARLTPCQEPRHSPWWDFWRPAIIGTLCTVAACLGLFWWVTS